MKHILIVKLSSMGDLVHALPALSDAVRAVPGVRFDWVVDEAFADVPSWHPAVDTLIKSAHRRWRKHIGQSLKNKEISTFVRRLRAKQYDAVIDMQSSHKSALVTRLARGERHGFAKGCTRERGAYWAYHHRYPIIFEQHAITRMRHLMAQVLGYRLEESILDYGIKQTALPALPMRLPQKYLIGVHNVSWPSKSWPAQHWKRLIQMAEEQGWPVVLPWGSPAEQEAAQQIAAGSAQAIVLPKLSLSQFIPVALGAQAAVCTDTGLAHILAALGIPAVTLYGPTDPRLIGTMGPSQIHLAPEQSCLCPYKKKCTHLKSGYYSAQCMVNIKPERVWAAVQTLLGPVDYSLE